jgi:hypothetical protein
MTQNQTSAAVLRKVWYKIYYSNVTTNREDMDMSSILINPEDDWDDLKRQLVGEIPELDGYHISQLELYNNEISLQQSERIRSVNQAIGDTVGKSSPIIVLVYPATSKKLRLSAGGDITEQPRSVWYTLVRDTIDGTLEGPVCSVPMRSQQLLYDLKVHCTPPNHSSEIANFEDHIKIYDFNQKLLDGSTPIGDIVTTRETSLRVVLPSDFKTFQWEPLNPSSSLNDGKLYFVNRDSAVRSLLRVCINNDQRKNTEGGPYHRIAIIDQNYGMGKTEFGNNFISQCKNVESTATEFIGEQGRLDRIKRCRTLPISFPQATLNAIMRIEDELLMQKELEAAFRDAILESVRTHISIALVKLLKADLESQTDGMKTSAMLLKLLMERTGKDPIFVVLDEMGTAFDGRQDDQTRRQLFIGLCNKLLVSWLRLVDLYFLIVGRGALFDWVGDRPYDDSYNFTRITFNIIREEKIHVILEKTYRNVGSQTAVSLNEFYKFTGDDKKKAVEAILMQTNGHPRSIQQMLFACETKEQLFSYQDPGFIDPDSLDILLSYQSALREILDYVEKGHRMNLSIQVRGRPKTYLQLVDLAKLRWEGDQVDARIYASPAAKRCIGAICSSFIAYLRLLVPNRYLELEWDRHFELLLIKRLQKMFEIPTQPGVAYPQFFPRSSRFFDLEEFRACCRIRAFPKITSKPNQTNPVEFDSPTVHPANWYKLWELMVKQESGTFLPDLNSASSDGIIVHTSKEKSTLTVVGIAAKCTESCPITGPQIDNEIALFNRVFNIPPEGPDEFRKNLSLQQVRVLMIFCTSGYRKNVTNPDHRKSREPEDAEPITQTIKAIDFAFDREKYPNVDSVLLFNLSTAELRAEFFGITSDSVLRNNLEFMSDPRHQDRKQAHL